MPDSQIGVDCQFEADGTLKVRRIFFDGRWLTVEQGRQWQDHLGRHVLIMFPEGGVRRIRLRPDTMTWELLRDGGRETQLV
ncbi:MAG: hypothetical protein JSW55_14600 [Chloroflexota bacterium]|nr:MAG: hypothetical protein JSW55_14600 [Chloroflexota bacterium]